jgi:hypothetical protein
VSAVSFEDIKRAFERERSERRPLVSADDLPTSYEAITPEWMTSVLAARHPGAKVTSLRLGDVDEGTSSRRRIFVDWNEAGTRAGLPASVFCKGSLHLENRYMLASNGGIEAEVDFYNLVRPHLPIEAPEPYFAKVDRRSFNSIIVMRDLGGEAKFCWHTPTLTRERARSQMRLLAALHARYWRSPELATTLGGFNTWETYFTGGAPKVAFDDAWTIYREQLFSALAWWTGTLGQPPEAPKMQPAETSLTFIERMTHAIDDLDALDA